MAEDRRRLWGDVKWGIGYGLVLALFVTVVASFNLMVLASDDVFAEGETVGSALSLVVPAYILAGIVVGAFVGLMRPALRSGVGTFFVGALAGTFGYSAVGLAGAEPGAILTGSFWLISLMAGVPVGGIVALYWRRKNS